MTTTHRHRALLGVALMALCSACGVDGSEAAPIEVCGTTFSQTSAVGSAAHGPFTEPETISQLPDGTLTLILTDDCSIGARVDFPIADAITTQVALATDGLQAGLVIYPRARKFPITIDRAPVGTVVITVDLPPTQRLRSTT
ncbi:hypothetical protein GIS00_06420 [Nakamurella sp. YIM 132087]|uniref:Uncharacterized protein n=1 Tax=Nakamurella alba TaxID=2665158 RepID=A0A7K1FJG0_9ACTN|nr:hypothetical protein [Nakamurella alba]MTD13579.1 hypothetical protein [Nakamurella alba]